MQVSWFFVFSFEYLVKKLNKFKVCRVIFLDLVWNICYVFLQPIERTPKDPITQVRTAYISRYVLNIIVCVKET